MASCPLCHTNNNHIFYSDENFEVFQCNYCSLLYKTPDQFLTGKEEKYRYLNHNNDVDDKGYQGFVSPIVDAVDQDFPVTAEGLDFGAGTGPVITEMLSEKGYSLTLYDTFFHSNKKALQQSYDFIVCCEVMEHFHHPDEEFILLKKLLKPKGKLYCMTELFSSEINFKEWYYKNDETHVVFYSEQTIKWIQKTFNFSEVKMEGRLIIFSA
ncbi:MAG TPA: methyltransferase [Flavobacteriaceae bacterium]|jgi:2-polyprenyl-3-methyl-5-hydroxy-6-metoxy-1,4-benzoquinol methylase|nr:methyltransferase [Flavobacteriaceae bacterium]|tara:strand:+ start:180588 stop:181220 length:633 start_codon:yes stop_codon:yes gene_type:complete